MRIVMVGLNHRTAPVELREKVALAGDDLDAALTELTLRFPAAECAVLSTCNRTEVYVVRGTHEPPSADELRALLTEYSAVSIEDITPHSIHREQEQALRHLFRVAAGLDSMVLGETQILGQVRRAYESAARRGTVGPVMHRVFQQALAAAKQVRTQTGIDAGRVSVGSVAVDFARQVFTDFTDKTVVGIGAGELAKTALRHLTTLQPKGLWLINRTADRAAMLAEQLHLTGPGGGVRPWEELDNLIVDADVILTSTGAREPVITAERFRPLLRKRRHRPLFIIDLAVPRDVEETIGAMSNVYLYNIDDLQSVIAETHGQRREQVERCEAGLADAVRSCLAQIQNRDLAGLIRQLRDRLNAIGHAERRRTVRKLDAGQDASDVIDEHTHRLINKILHLPLSQLDGGDPDAPLGFYAAALRRLFDLDDAVATEKDIAESAEAQSPRRQTKIEPEAEVEIQSKELSFSAPSASPRPPR